MPLHLLGKKSWNVYNQENIARVRRDEVQARAREEAEERRMQEVDAERRIQLLRGLQPGSPPRRRDNEEESRASHSVEGRDRKRRRIAGEDDTDREIRLAKEDAAAVSDKTERTRKSSTDAPLTGHDGHINLFPSEHARHGEKNPEAEAEAAKKKREHEDQYTMRFSNAAGFKQGLEKPWYSSTEARKTTVNAAHGKDVWGNADPLRHERENIRVAAADPLVAMKRGVKQLREAEKDRRQWLEEREKEMQAMEEAEQRKRHRRRRRHSDGSLEEFSLEAPLREKDDRHRRHSHRHSHRHRDRTRNRSRERSGRRDATHKPR